MASVNEIKFGSDTNITIVRSAAKGLSELREWVLCIIVGLCRITD